MKYQPSKGTVYSSDWSPIRIDGWDNFRSFTNDATGEIFRMKVTIERAGKSVIVKGYLNDEIAYNQTWLIDTMLAMRYSFLGYLPNVDAAISGAFDCMMSKLPK